MRTLISWLGYTKDFTEDNSQGAADLTGRTFRADGPTGELWDAVLRHYDQHIVLVQRNGTQPDVARKAAIKRHLAGNPYAFRVELVDVNIDRPTDFRSINQVVQPIIVEALDADEGAGEAEAFISTGSGTMQAVWYFLAQTTARLRIFQTSRAAQRPPGLPDLREYIDVSQARTALGLLQRSSHAEHADRAAPIDSDPGGLLRDTLSLREVYRRARAVAATDKTYALIIGESGAGKEDVARYLHDQSARRPRRFVAVNCAALSDTLLESQLFGYEKGAFTGAEKATPGLFEAAHRGTIFLDEIGDVSPYLQQSLLRVLQEGEIRPVGSTKPKPVNVRVIAATHRDLPGRCAAGHFRWDLYYRLAVAEITVPAFRERGSDERRAFIDNAVRTTGHRLGRERLQFSASAKTHLEAYAFPGNLRELANVIESLYVFCEGEVQVEDLPVRLRQNETTHSWKMADVERAHIARAMAFFEEKKVDAARALGMSRSTLDKKLKES